MQRKIFLAFVLSPLSLFAMEMQLKHHETGHTSNTQNQQFACLDDYLTFCCYKCPDQTSLPAMPVEYNEKILSASHWMSKQIGQATTPPYDRFKSVLSKMSAKAKDQKGLALIDAVQEGKIRLAQILLECGANPEIAEKLSVVLNFPGIMGGLAYMNVVTPLFRVIDARGSAQDKKSFAYLLAWYGAEINPDIAIFEKSMFNLPPPYNEPYQYLLPASRICFASGYSANQKLSYTLCDYEFFKNKIFNYIRQAANHNLNAVKRGDKGRTAEQTFSAHNQQKRDLAQRLKSMTAGVRDPQGNTPLHKAIQLGQNDLALMLFYAFPLVANVHNKQGHTPVQCAVYHCPEFLGTILLGMEKNAQQSNQ